MLLKTGEPQQARNSLHITKMCGEFLACCLMGIHLYAAFPCQEEADLRLTLKELSDQRNLLQGVDEDKANHKQGHLKEERRWDRIKGNGKEIEDEP